MPTDTPNTTPANGDDKGGAAVTEALSKLEKAAAEAAAKAPKMPGIVKLPEDDARIALEHQGELDQLHLELGRACEQHYIQEARVMDVLQKIGAQRKEISSLTQTLARKHIKEPGKQYTLAAEIGAFVQVQAGPAFIPSAEGSAEVNPKEDTQ